MAIAGYTLWIVVNVVGLLLLIIIGLLAYALIGLGIEATAAFLVAAGLVLAAGAAVIIHNDPSYPTLFPWSERGS